MDLGLGNPLECSPSMVFILALSVPWCRYLSCQEGVAPHLYADSLNCTTTVEDALLRAVRFSDLYLRAVWQEASQVCGHLEMHEGLVHLCWAVKLDIRDLGGHLDVTHRERAGTLSNRVCLATSQVHVVGASVRVCLATGQVRMVSGLPLGFQVGWLDSV